MHDTTKIHTHFDTADGPRRCACGKHLANHDTARNTTMRDRPIAAAKSEQEQVSDLRRRLTNGWTETTPDDATEAPINTPPLSEQDQSAMVRHRLSVEWARSEEE